MAGDIFRLQPESASWHGPSARSSPDCRPIAELSRWCWRAGCDLSSSAWQCPQSTFACSMAPATLLTRVARAA